MFIQSRVARGFSLGAVNGQQEWLLPSNPISHIDISIKAQVVAANFADNALSLADQLSSIQVLYRGTQIYSIRGADLLRLMSAMGVFGSQFYNPAVAAASNRSLLLRVPFNRQQFNEMECFPRTAKGDATILIQWTAVSSYNTITLDIATYELPQATPKNFVRVTTLTDTPAATGDKDYDLPRFAPLLGIGFYMTSSFPTAATPTINTAKILLNNLDTGYTDMESTMGRDQANCYEYPRYGNDQILQQENSAAAYTQFALTTAPHYTDGPSRDFFYLDYDPGRDGKHLLMGPGATDLKARLNIGVANALRIMPVEWFAPNMLPNYKGG
jgi:hypothetical protein